jgi:hypothetical protein
MENRPVNPTIKSTVPPRANVSEPQPDKKSTKTTTTTTTKSTAQKGINSSKPTVNAPVKPMPNKKTLSPMDDRLSDEECIFILFILFRIKKYFIFKASPESDQPAPPAPAPAPPPIQPNVIHRRQSHTTLG